MFIGDLDRFTKVVGSLDRIKPMVDKNVLALNKTQVIHYQFQELLLTKLDLILRHLEILTNGPDKLGGVLQPNNNLPHRTI